MLEGDASESLDKLEGGFDNEGLEIDSFKDTVCQFSQNSEVWKCIKNENEDAVNENALVRMAKALWETRNNKKSVDQHKIIKKNIRDLLIYVFFVSMILIIALLPTLFLKTYFYTDIVQRFTSSLGTADNIIYTKIRNLDAMWKYILTDLVSAIYDTGLEQYTTSTHILNTDTKADNKMIGRPRIRQVCVKPMTCYGPATVRRFVSNCYPKFSQNFEETKQLIPNKNFSIIHSHAAWTWRSTNEIGADLVTGLYSKYPGSGYVLYWSTEKNITLTNLYELFTGLWIQDATRAVIIDFTLYNANLNLFGNYEFLFEIPDVGGVISSADFRPFYLNWQYKPLQYVVFSCQLIATCFAVYYILTESLELKSLGLAYFKCFWNLIDIVVIVLTITSFSLSMYQSLISHRIMQKKIDVNTSYREFIQIGFWCLQYNRVLALLVFFALIKIFKYISFSESMGQLTATLNYACYDIIGFAVMFGIVFAAFVQAGNLMFGRNSALFNSCSQTAFVLYRIILGDFDMKEIRAADRIFGPLYFVIYIFFVFFVILNMFLAIISDAYAKVKKDMARRCNDFKFLAYVRHSMDEFVGNLLKRDRISLDKVLDTVLANTKELDFSFFNWRREMKRSGYSDIESTIVFNKYDKNFDRILEFSEQRKMREDMAMGIGFMTEPTVLEDEETETEKCDVNQEHLINSFKTKNTSIFADAEDCEDLNERISEAHSELSRIVKQISLILSQIKDAEVERHKNEIYLLHQLM